MGLMPIRVREGSIGHRIYTVAPWLLAYRGDRVRPVRGRRPGSRRLIDQALRISQLNNLVAFAIVILGLDIVVGRSGQLSLGQSAFVGLGAYTTMILVADHHWSYLANAAGLGHGLLRRRSRGRHPRGRVKGMYLAVVTLCVAYVFPPLVLKYGWLTGGPNGKGPPRTRASCCHRHGCPSPTTAASPSRCGCTACA